MLIGFVVDDSLVKLRGEQSITSYTPTVALPNNALHLAIMASASDTITLVSSLALRLSIWIFLRWVNTTIYHTLLNNN